MASQRMIKLALVETNKFMELPIRAQYLYYNLILRADDDGFAGNTRLILGFCGADVTDLQLLRDKGYIFIFESGVCLIRHWKHHNHIRPSIYQETYFTEEREQVYLNDRDIYELKETETKEIEAQGGNSSADIVSLPLPCFDTSDRSSTASDTHHCNDSVSEMKGTAAHTFSNSASEGGKLPLPCFDTSDRSSTASDTHHCNNSASEVKGIAAHVFSNSASEGGKLPLPCFDTSDRRSTASDTHHCNDSASEVKGIAAHVFSNSASEVKGIAAQSCNNSASEVKGIAAHVFSNSASEVSKGKVNKEKESQVECSEGKSAFHGQCRTEKHGTTHTPESFFEIDYEVTGGSSARDKRPNEDASTHTQRDNCEVVMRFPAHGGDYCLTREKLKELEKTYNRIDVMQSLERIRKYLCSNPEKQRSHRATEGYIDLWLSDDAKKRTVPKSKGQSRKKESILEDEYADYETYSVVDILDRLKGFEDIAQDELPDSTNDRNDVVESTLDMSEMELYERSASSLPPDFF